MPTITYTNNTTGGDSTAIVEADLSVVFPTFNFDGNTSMYCEHVSGVTDRVIWMKVTDLSGIPSGSTINSVTVEIYRDSGFSSGGATHYVRRCLRDVLVSQLTGNNARTGTAWTTVGALSDGNDRAASNSGTMSVDNTNGYKSASGSGMVTLFQDWVNGTNSNFGFFIFPDTTDDVYSTFTQSEGTDGQRPRVIIDYTTAGGSAGGGLASKTAPIKSLVNGGLVAARHGIFVPQRKIIIPQRAPLRMGRNFHSEARL